MAEVVIVLVDDETILKASELPGLVFVKLLPLPELFECRSRLETEDPMKNAAKRPMKNITRTTLLTL